MQVQTKQISDTRVQLTIIADQGLLDTIKADTLQTLRQRVKLPGFRDGKAPLAMVERSVDPSLMQTEFLEAAINRLYVDAATEAKLRPVAEPKIELKKFVPFTTLEITAEVDVIGEVTLPDYKKLRLDKPVVKVTAADVAEVLENLQTRLAEKADVDRAAKDGDEVVIDFTGTDLKDQTPVQGGAGTDYPLVLGSNSFIPGFETNLVGLKAGADKTFTITFPKDYGVAALQGRAVSFAVTIKAVKELVKPKLDDDLAPKVGPFKTLADLKADIKRQLTEDKTEQAERDYNNEIITQLSAKAKVAIPDQVVDDELDSLEREERQNLVYRGQTWQEHLDAEGVTEAEHREKNRAPAAERVKAGLMLAEIAEQENIVVSPDELDTHIQLLKGQYTDTQMQAELDKPENRRNIASRLITDKTIAKLREYVKAK